MLKSDINYGYCCQRFATSYEVSSLPAMREVERTVLGCDYGGTSWTTRAQAEQIVEMLDLQPDLHLLDIGAGSGWPGLFLADSGWQLVKRSDVTSDHRKSLSALVKAFDESAELPKALGHEAVNESRKGRQEQIAVLDAGLLVREIFLVAAN